MKTQGKTVTTSHFPPHDGDRTPTMDASLSFGLSVRVEGRVRKVTIQVGRYYIVAPSNPRSRRHRGRPCQILELDDSFMPGRAAVRFTDARGRWAIVDTGDLGEPGTAAGPVAEPQQWSLSKMEKKTSLLCTRLRKETTSARIAEANTLMGKLGHLRGSGSPGESRRCDELAAMLMSAMVEAIAKASGRPAHEVAEEIRTDVLRRLAH